MAYEAFMGALCCCHSISLDILEVKGDEHDGTTKGIEFLTRA